MKALKVVKAYPLSDDDIRRVLGHDIKIWNYPQLEGLRNIDEMFDSKGRAILLYPNAGRNAGHWVCLMNCRDGIHYFDSYGEEPEEPRDDVPEEQKVEWGIEYPFLTRLLKSSGKPVFSNTYQFQSSNPAVADCGRHACVRLLYAQYSLAKYKAIIKKSKLTPDDFVTGVTFDKLKK